MNNIILKDYQEKFINSKEKIVIGNFERRRGKTFCIVQKILKEKPEKVVICSPSLHNSFDIVDRICKNPNVARCEKRNNCYHIFWKDIKSFTVIIVASNEESLRGLYTNNTLIVFKELKFIKNAKKIIQQCHNFKQIVCITTENNSDKHLQNDYPNADIIESKNYNNAYINYHNFLQNTLEELMKEYENTAIANNTIMTRQNLLEMILKIIKEIRSTEIFKQNQLFNKK